MKRLFLFILISIVILTGCGHSGSGSVSQSSKDSQVKLVFKGEELTLSHPAILKNDCVYVPWDVLNGLTGVKAEYNQANGEITAARKEIKITLKIGQPLKPEDKKGRTAPFLERGTVYLPVSEALDKLEYRARQEKDANGVIVVSLEKMGFDTSDLWQPFSPAELKLAEEALAQGVTIDDLQGDWAPIKEGIQPDGRPDNDKPYPFAYTDIRSVTFGADSQYLYLKVVVDGAFPDELPYYHNDVLNKTDFIKSMCANLDLSHFLNRNTGIDDVGLMQLGMTYVQGGDNQNTDNPTLFVPPIVGISNFATLSGDKDKNNEDIYVVSNSKGRVGGGAGMNNMTGAFPLSNFGLQLGDVIEFDISMETGSKIFHHECIDVILDCNYKLGETIRYQLGANTYDNLGPPEK